MCISIYAYMSILVAFRYGGAGGYRTRSSRLANMHPTGGTGHVFRQETLRGHKGGGPSSCNRWLFCTAIVMSNGDQCLFSKRKRSRTCSKKGILFEVFWNCWKIHLICFLQNARAKMAQNALHQNISSYQVARKYLVQCILGCQECKQRYRTNGLLTSYRRTILKRMEVASVLRNFSGKLIWQISMFFIIFPIVFCNNMRHENAF